MAYRLTNAHVLRFRICMWTQTPDCKHNSCKIIMAYRLTNAHVLPFRMWTQTPDCKHNSCKSYGCSKGLWYMEVKHIDTVLLLL